MKNAEKPDGYFLPIHRSCIEVILVGGVERSLFWFNWTIGFAIGAMGQQYWFFLVTFFLHYIFREMNKSDKILFAVVKNSLQNKKNYW